jgi:hypothetical protein
MGSLYGQHKNDYNIERIYSSAFFVPFKCNETINICLLSAAYSIIRDPIKRRALYR